MIIFPAIDILGGKAVRLKQGRYDAVTVYNDSPVDQARRFQASGAEWIHVVDLDGARTGEPANIALVEAIAALGMRVETGGGVRSMATLERLFAAGVERVVLGTALIREPALVAQATAKYDGIVAGVDARDGMVAIEGWREGTDHEVFALVSDLEAAGVRRVVYTDISRDGMQTGVNEAAYRALIERSGMQVVASGGVSTLDDLRRLAALGPRLEGVIAGRAIYEGAFTLEQALAVARGEA